MNALAPAPFQAVKPDGQDSRFGLHNWKLFAGRRYAGDRKSAVLGTIKELARSEVAVSPTPRGLIGCFYVAFYGAPAASGSYSSSVSVSLSSSPCSSSRARRSASKRASAISTLIRPLRNRCDNW